MAPASRPAPRWRSARVMASSCRWPPRCPRSSTGGRPRARRSRCSCCARSARKRIAASDGTLKHLGFFDKIKQSLTRTKEQFVGRFDEIVRRADEPAHQSRGVDIETVDALEEALISADVGVAATDRIVTAVRERRGRGESLRALVKAEILSILRAAEKPMIQGKPQVVVIVGVY